MREWALGALYFVNRNIHTTDYITFHRTTHVVGNYETTVQCIMVVLNLKLVTEIGFQHFKGMSATHLITGMHVTLCYI